MIGNVSKGLRRVLPALDADDVGEVPLIYLYIGFVDLYEGHKLVIVTIGSTPCHTLEVTFEHSIDILLGGCRSVETGRRRECTGILAFRISTKSTAWENFKEGLVVVGMLPHVGNDSRTYFVVFFLGAIQLIGKCVEETVA